MGAFILAGIVLGAAVLLGLFVGFAQSMASAPAYDNKPWWIMGVGAVIAALIVASHWLPHIGW